MFVGCLLRHFLFDLFKLFLEYLIVNRLFFAPRLAFGVWLRRVGGYFASINGLEPVGLPFQFGA